MVVSTPSQTCLARETGESGPLFLEVQPAVSREAANAVCCLPCFFRISDGKLVEMHFSFVYCRFQARFKPKFVPFLDDTSIYRYTYLWYESISENIFHIFLFCVYKWQHREKSNSAPGQETIRRKNKIN